MKRGFEMPEIFASERAIRTKAQTVEIMDQAFHLARDLIRQMPDSDLEKHLDFFGQPIAIRGLLIRMGDHLSQHLGQSIAYARINHIVPPLVAEEGLIWIHAIKSSIRTTGSGPSWNTSAALGRRFPVRRQSPQQAFQDCARQYPHKSATTGTLPGA
jgi:hypothetical protein